MATTWAPACPQSHEPITEHAWGAAHLGSLDHDEHCQRLSVTVPVERRAGEALPVMVWIHGGAYIIGAGDAPIHDPAQLVREHRVIVVTVTYRLGILGFLGSARGRPANLGLLDLIEALRWIGRNIAAFGGDPHNVTLFGHSAGGDAIAHLIDCRRCTRAVLPRHHSERPSRHRERAGSHECVHGSDGRGARSARDL
jgi:para-nitrobenzyl esterase